MKNNLKRIAGYTIDQTILIVAVIAVLITLIISSVGWDLLNRASGTKLASYFKQIEDANGQFYAKMGVWVHDAMDQTGVAARRNAEGYILALKDRNATFTNSGQSIRFYSKFEDYLPGFTTNSGSTEVQHTFGNGGKITQDESTTGQCPGYSTFLRITMAGVPEEQIFEADDNIDNGDDRSNGRLRWTNPSNGIADVSYCANIVR